MHTYTEFLDLHRVNLGAGVVVGIDPGVQPNNYNQVQLVQICEKLRRILKHVHQGATSFKIYYIRIFKIQNKKRIVPIKTK